MATGASTETTRRADTHGAADPRLADDAHGAHGSHASDRSYIGIAIILAVLTAAETATYFIPAFERLREWRRKRADGKPAYTVLTDATLRVLADSKPSTERELARVQGIGPTKLQNYGDELLALLEELRTTD